MTIAPDPLEFSLEGAESTDICCVYYMNAINFGYAPFVYGEKMVFSSFTEYDPSIFQYYTGESYFRVVFWYKDDPDTIIAAKKIILNKGQ